MLVILNYRLEVIQIIRLGEGLYRHIIPALSCVKKDVPAIDTLVTPRIGDTKIMGPIPLVWTIRN